MKTQRTVRCFTIALLLIATCLRAAEPSELRTLRTQRDTAIEQVQQEAKAKEKRLNEQYFRALDSLMQTFTRAGNLDAALAVRDEKTSVADAIGTPAPSEGGMSKPPTVLAKPPVHPGQNKIVEGEGWRGFRVGATREELIKDLGKPDNDPKDRWLQWKKKYSIHCLLDDTRGAFELRFDQGFKDETTQGIGIGSSLKKALAAYGEPTTQEDRGGAKKLIWSSKGILIWFGGDKASQIVVFKKK
jgi:uncharacterized protein YecT (DUF1311 family)